MGLKILLNIFYNISLFLLVLSLVWCFNHGRYDLLAASVFLFALFLVLKIRLIKQVRTLTKR
jgi:hypothetical protein